MLARAPYPNAILVGTSDITAAALTLLLGHLQRPIVQWDPSTAQDVPPHMHGTLVICNLDMLNPLQQRRLIDTTADECRATQIISIATSALFERVLARAFS